MVGDNYYRVSALPALGDLGTPPPLTPATLREHVADSRTAGALIDVILLESDLLEREAFLAGEIREVEPSVLSPAQVRNEEPLPEFLAAEEEPGGPRVAADAVWAAYFRHAAATAARLSSSLLSEWIAFEVALRNALAAARARALELDPAGYLVTPDLGRSDMDVSPIVIEWSAAADPLAGLRVLDRARWTWLAEHEAWFSFTDDELAAYAVKLMLLVRWRRLSAEARRGHR